MANIVLGDNSPIDRLPRKPLGWLAAAGVSGTEAGAREARTRASAAEAEKVGQVLVDGVVVDADIGERGVGEAAGDEGEVLAGSAVEVLGGGDCG